MLYLIGLGLGLEGISKEGLKALDKCDKIYLESYTIEFPYSKKELEKSLGKKIIIAERDDVESFKILERIGEENIALLIYGNPLMATTHISLIGEAEKRGMDVKVIHGPSVLDAISETGLQIYKFGKTTSMPNFEAISYLDTIKSNLSIGAHTLILIDIGMEFKDALKRLEKDVGMKKIDTGKIIVCSRLGTNDKKIFLGGFDELRKLKDIPPPFCFIFPGDLHFLEKETLESFKK